MCIHIYIFFIINIKTFSSLFILVTKNIFHKYLDINKYVLFNLIHAFCLIVVS